MPGLSRGRKHDAHQRDDHRADPRRTRRVPACDVVCGGRARCAPGAARAALAQARRTERDQEAGRRRTTATRSTGIMSDGRMSTTGLDLLLTMMGEKFCNVVSSRLPKVAQMVL